MHAFKFTLILRLHCGGVHNFHPSFPTNSENRTISQYPFKAVGVAVLFLIAGGCPYPNMDGRRIAARLQEGYRMPKPSHVDDQL